MTILVDRPRWPWQGRRWAHLITDSDIVELHRFAAEAGLPERAFHRDHYDVPDTHWQHIVDQGASVVSSREVVEALRRGGFR